MTNNREAWFRRVEELSNAYDKTDRVLRFGQYVINQTGIKGCSDIYYERDGAEAYQMLLALPEELIP